MATASVIHQKQEFPLRISEKLEKKIRVLCNKFPANEWSGILFYTYSGSFETKDIAFIAEDLLLMDTGTSVTTEFYLDEGNAAEYIVNHELWDCQMGLIHSHQAMQAFFSSTDDNTLFKEGMARNHFLSLVVNNKGEYVARVTRKETYEYSVKGCFKYKTFNDVEKIEEIEEKQEEETVVSTYDLQITKDFNFTCDDYDELMDSIKQIDVIKKERAERERKEKEAKQPKQQTVWPFGSTEPCFEDGKAYYAYNNKKPVLEAVEPELNFEEAVPTPPEVKVKEVTEGFEASTEGILSQKIIDGYVAQLLWLSPLAKNKPLSGFEKELKARFENMYEYQAFLSIFCDYLLDSELVEELDCTFDPREIDDVYFIVKMQIADTIHALPNQNVYTQELYKYLTTL